MKPENKFVAWFKRVVLGQKPEPVVQPEPYRTPDEVADLLANEANDLFAQLQAKRAEAARVLDEAAQEAREQAEALQRRAEENLRIAAERATKAARNSQIAERLREFLD